VTGRISAFGDRALLLEPLEPLDGRTAWCLAVAQAAALALPGTTVLPGLASVLVALDDPAMRLGEARRVLRDVLDALPEHPPTPRTGQLHALPAHYDGPDLATVAASLGTTAAALAARHRATTWTVAAIGFSPGFGYLVPDDDAAFADVPRLRDPRARVPAGSIALAAGMCAVYPSASPGGWQLIGRTDAVLFDPSVDPPARLAVGDRVRFVEAP
jgi:KipI family sensor histidine kinase inhibitor